MDGAPLDPGIPDGETTTYRGVVDGTEQGTGTHTVEHDGDDAYRQRISIAVGDGGVGYAMESRFARVRGTLLAESYRMETTWRGERVALEEGRFRDVKVLQFGGEVKAYPRGMSPLLGCGVALRGLEWERGFERDLTLWLANTAFWDVHVVVEGREKVRVPAGSFDAWKVRVTPSVEEVSAQLDRMVQPLIPPFVLHFHAEPAHRLLRFEFPTGPFPWNPTGVVEATEVG